MAGLGRHHVHPRVFCYTLNQLKFWVKFLKVTNHSPSGRRSFRCSTVVERLASVGELGSRGVPPTMIESPATSSNLSSLLSFGIHVRSILYDPITLSTMVGD